MSFSVLLVLGMHDRFCNNQFGFTEEIESLGGVLDISLFLNSQINQLPDKLEDKLKKSLDGLRTIKPCTTQALRKKLV